MEGSSSDTRRRYGNKAVGQSSKPPLPRNRSSSYSTVIPPPPETQTDIETSQIPPAAPAQIEEPVLDEKNFKRMMQSRRYSEKYRMKQLGYISYLESEVKSLQAEIQMKLPRLQFSDHLNSLLRSENLAVREKISACSGELMFKEAQYEELKRERDALKETYNVIYQGMTPEPMLPTNIAGNNYHPAIDQPGFTHFTAGGEETPMFMEDQNQNQNQNQLHQTQDLTNMNSVNFAASSSSFNNFY